MLEELARREQVPGEINKEIADRKLLPESAALTVGGIAALLVGACCFAPAVLMSIGLGGAWLSNLSLLEPYRPIFIAVALIALAFAWRRIYRPAVACAPDAVCAVPRVRRGYKVALWMVAALLVVTFAFPYFAPVLFRS